MKTYDLFGTLATSRLGMNAGEVPVEEHISIAENVAKVRPEDVIVSDYHTPLKALEILRTVCGLNNELVCTEDGKATGKIWNTVKSEGHLGDNLHCDVRSPRAKNIPAELTTLADFTPHERTCGELGLVMREARLTTHNVNPVLRGLQLHQIERNFPFLYLAAQMIDKRMRDGGFTRLLLCSRDCFLLERLMRRLASYEIEYFYTSRVTRWHPSIDYAHYAKERLSGQTLIVDLNGTGSSLKYLTGRFGGTPLLVCGFNAKVDCLTLGGIREVSNQAPHGMVIDVTKYDGMWTPITIEQSVNPAVETMVNAFDECLNRLRQPMKTDYSLGWAVSQVNSDKATDCLLADHIAESHKAYELIMSGSLPADAVVIQ